MPELSIAGLGIKFQTTKTGPKISGPASNGVAIKKAVIIAAGRGSRLQEPGKAVRPKPLAAVAGLSLLERTILSMKKAGIREFIVVIGYRGAEIRHIIQSKNLGVSIEWIENHDWPKQNGLSVLAAEGRVQGTFLLSMSDHLFSASLVQRLMQESLSYGDLVLAVDRATQAVPDLEDATKLLVQEGRVTDIGKTLENYNAIDTGLFLCTPALFTALRKCQVRGDCSLSDGIRELAAAGQVKAHDIQGAFWLDVDTPEALALAEKRLFEQLVKPQDGFLAKRFNRPLSLRVSRRLARTQVTPNQITLGLLGVGLLAAYFFAQGSYAAMLLGALLFQLQSILDGCDGEIARLKFQESKWGGILDVLCDGLVTAAGFWGMGQGVSQQTGNPGHAALGLIAAWTALGCTAMLFLLVRRSGRWSGSFQSLSPFREPRGNERLTTVLDGLSRRDYTYLVLGLAVLGKISWFLWLVSLGTTVYLFGLLILYGVSYWHEKA